MHPGRITVRVTALLVTLVINGCGGSSSPAEPTPGDGGLQRGAPWPTAGGNAQRTRASAATGPADPVAKWKFTAPDSRLLATHCPPAIAADGTIYVASESSRAYALEPNGALRWTVEVPGHCAGSPSIGADGTVYFVNAEVNAVSPAGRLLWSYTPEEDEASSAVAIGDDGTLYVALESVGLQALSPAGGARFRIAGETKSTPAIAPDGTVYFGLEGALVAITPSGTEKWRLPLGAPETFSPSIGPDGTVYGFAQNGDGSPELVAASPSGVELWRVAAGGDDTVAIAGDSTLYAPGGDQLDAFDSNGALLWSAEGVAMPPAIDAQGVAYAGSHSGCLATAIDRDGTAVWSLPVDDLVGCGAPVLGADGTLYFTQSNGLVAIGSK